MCTIINNKATDQFKRENAGKEWVTCWKVLEKVSTGDSVYLRSPYQGFPYKPNIPVKAEKPIGSPVEFFWNGVYGIGMYGVHTLLTKKDAEEFVEKNHTHTYYTTVIVPVKCKMKDFLAVGSFDTIDGKPNNVVFREVVLEEKDYEEAIK